MASEAISKSSKRIYYMDYLRAFIIFIVIILHSLLPYVPGYDWMVNDNLKTTLYGMSATVIDVFIMPIMFFVAGYFAFPSIRKGIKDFLVNKVIRIAIPFFIGITFLAPIMSYINDIHHGRINVSYLDYWLNIHFSGFIVPRHFWFLSSLFFFFVVFAVVFSLFKDKLEDIYEKSKVKTVSAGSIAMFLIGFFALSVFLFYMVERVWFDALWVEFLKFISFQPTRWTGYILYFIMGIVVFIKRVDFSERFLKSLPLLIVTSIVATYAFIMFKLQVYYFNMNFLKPDIQLYNAIVHIAYCFLLFITFMALFKKYMDQPSKAWGRMASNSYTVYIVHMVIVVLIQYYTLNINTSIHIKFLITLICSTAISFVLSEIILKTISVFKSTFIPATQNKAVKT